MKFIPWRVSYFFNVHFHKIWMLAKFGTTNLNTRKHWDERFSTDAYIESEATENVFKAMEDLITEGATVLDVGVGSGYFLKRIRKSKNAKVFALDISPVIIERLKNIGIDGCCCELPAKPQISNRFDFITAKALLEHLVNPSDSLKVIADLLKPSGQLLVSVPNDRLGPESEPEHLRKYNKDSLYDELNQHLIVKRIDIIDKCLLAICNKNTSMIKYNKANAADAKSSAAD